MHVSYQVTDKLSIPNLIETAFDRLKAMYHDGLPTSPEFAEFVDRAFRSTARDDLQLQTWVTKCCIEAHANNMVVKKLQQVVKKHEPVAWTVGRDLCGHNTATRATGWTCDNCGSLVNSKDYCPYCGLAP
jgi:rubrerythrin